MEEIAQPVVMAAASRIRPRLRFMPFGRHTAHAGSGNYGWLMAGDNGLVDALSVARDYWLKPIYPEQMPYVAAELLASGYDTPSLREAAGVSASDAAEARRLFIDALHELGAWVDQEQAELYQAALVARSFTRDEISIDSLVSALMRLWDLDEVMYGGVPEPAQRLANLAWHREGSRLYQEEGGDEALRREAKFIASFCQSEQ
jgi:hypothetical protein